MRYGVHQTRENKYFKYGIQVIGSMLDFHHVREWFTTTYGIGDDIARDEPLQNGHWAFQLSYSIHMIYVKGDDELSWFKLKYGQET